MTDLNKPKPEFVLSRQAKDILLELHERSKARRAQKALEQQANEDKEQSTEEVNDEE